MFRANPEVEDNLRADPLDELAISADCPVRALEIYRAAQLPEVAASDIWKPGAAFPEPILRYTLVPVPALLIWKTGWLKLESALR